MPYIGNVLTSFAVETGNISDQAITSPKLSATGGTDGQVLALDSNGDLVWSSDPAGQWVTSGNDIFYTTGNIGIGVSSPGQALDIADTDTAPLRVTRDQAVSSGAGLVLRQPDTTDGNDLRIVYQTDTTGTGASSDVFFAALEFTAATHDHDTRAGEIGFYTAQGGTGFVERMRIDSAGNVGIGSANPHETITARGNIFLEADSTAADSGQAIYWQSTTNGWNDEQAHAAIYGRRVDANSGYLRFDTRSSGTTTERARIDSSGRLLIGHDTSIRGGALEVFAETADTQIQVTESSDSGDGPQFRMTRTRGSDLGSPSPVQDGNNLGRIRWTSWDSAAYRIGAEISAHADGQTWASSDCPTRLMFSTTADAGSSPTTRMTIKANGNVGIGTDDPQATLELLDTATNTYLRLSGNSGNAVDTNYAGIEFYNTDASGAGPGVQAWIEARNIGNTGVGADLAFGTFPSASSPEGARGNERMRIDGSGHILVGTDTTVSNSSAPSIECIGNTNRGGELTLGRNDTDIDTDHSIGFITFRGNDSDGDYDQCASITCLADGAHSNTGKPSRIVFSTTGSGSTSPTERLRITSDGTLQLRNSPGIDFSQIQGAPDAGTSESEVLDSYEEGTFTPEFANASSGGTESSSYTTRDGRYTKIGNLVHVDIYFKNVDVTGLGSSQFFIRGLPFAIKGGSIYIGQAGLSKVDLNSTASNLYSFANATSGSISSIRVFQSKDNTGHSAIPCDAVTDGDNEIFVTMTYPAA